MDSHGHKTATIVIGAVGALGAIVALLAYADSQHHKHVKDEILYLEREIKSLQLLKAQNEAEKQGLV